jgi:hypothetical protein
MPCFPMRLFFQWPIDSTPRSQAGVAVRKSHA